VQRAIAVYRQQVNERAVCGGDLTADQQKWLTEDRRVGFDELLQP
jgi:hypothetical protein